MSEQRDAAPRFKAVLSDDPKRGSIYDLIDTTTGDVVGWDGGEPEDQSLGRDWSWVPELLNRVAAEACAERTAERDEARRVLLAIGEDVYSHPYRYTLAMLRRVLGIPFHGVDIAAPDIRAALRKVCGAAQ